MRIDAHQHFWAIERGDYAWLTPGLAAIYRNFGPGDLSSLLTARGIDGTVLVQAAPTTAETDYMLGLATKTPFVKGVVGWVDFDAPDAPAQIETRAKDPLLVGLRPMIQDLADDEWMLKSSLTPAFQAMIEAGLVFDALTKPRHLPYLRVLLSQHPKLKTVIDHGSKPDIAAGDLKDWKRDMRLIAQTTSAFVKLSGLVTEAGTDHSAKRLRPTVAHLLEVFGPERLIWGSDWPVSTLACPYEEWCVTTDELLSDLSAAERDLILGGNAINLYELSLQDRDVMAGS